MMNVPLTRLIATFLLMALLWVGVMAETTAQTEALRLILTATESRDFPEVVISAAVTDAEGPVAGLTETDFQVFEAGAATPAEIVAVEPARLENLRLVLAVDVSTPESDLAGVKAAALSVVDGFSPKDRLALVSFGDEVQVVREFTNNQEELATAIDNLRSAGSFTALNEATAQAARLATQVQEGRRAVVIITDRLDNTETNVSFGEALETAAAAGLPVYLVGYGARMTASEPLEGQLQSTGGRYVTLDGAGGLEAALAEVEQTVRQGYHLTFLSNLTADEADHPLTVLVDYQDRQAEAEGVFTATPGAVNITLPTLEPGQTVSGMVDLAPEITAPTGVVSVEYLLDDEPLEMVTTPPFGLAWDSTTAGTGLHILSIRATDQAGNTGQMRIAVNVKVPLAVEISTEQETVQLGDALPISANVEAAAPIARMDLLIDGVLIDSRTEAPYLFDLNSGLYTQGQHDVTLRVETLEGETAEDSLTLQFLPPPGPAPNLLQRFLMNPWVRFSGVTIAALSALGATLLIALLLVRMIRRWHHRRSRQTLHLEIWNLGNIDGVYQLQAKEATDNLKFRFTLNGQDLPQQTITQPLGGTPNGTTGGRRPATQPLPATPALAAEAATPNGAAAAQPSSPDASAGSGVGQTVAKAREKESQARGCLYIVTDILDTLGMLLPGAAGNAVRNYSARLYQGQQAVDRAVRAPTQMANTAQHLGRQVSDLGPGSQQQGGYQPDTGRTGGRMEATPGRNVASTPVALSRPAPVRQTGRQPGGKRNEFLTATESWVRTPLLEPEGQMQIDLLILPANPYRKQDYTFTVVSKPVEPADLPVTNEPGTVTIPGIPWFYRYLPTFLVIFSALCLVIGIIWLTIWRFNLMNIWTLLLA